MNVQTSELNKWEVCENILPEGLNYSQFVTTKNRVYLLGGYNGVTWVTTVYSAPIDSEGVIGEWVTAASLPGPLGDSQAIVTKNRVYLLGGYNGSNSTSTVYSAPIDSEGLVGEWTAAASLPGPLDRSQVMVTKTRVYLLGGGNDSAYVSTVYSAPIDSEGVVGTWSATASLPGPLRSSQSIVTKTRVYLVGGVNDRGDIATVYSSPIDSEGVIGTWNPTSDSSVSFTGIEEKERPDEKETWTSLTDDLRMVKDNLPNISLDSLRKVIDIVKSDINNQNL